MASSAFSPAGARLPLLSLRLSADFFPRRKRPPPRGDFVFCRLLAAFGLPEGADLLRSVERPEDGGGKLPLVPFSAAAAVDEDDGGISRIW
jgi:hypothetical protein